MFWLFSTTSFFFRERDSQGGIFCILCFLLSLKIVLSFPRDGSRDSLVLMVLFCPRDPLSPCSQFTSLSLKQNSFISIRQTIWLENTVILAKTQKLMASTRDRLTQEIAFYICNNSQKQFGFIARPSQILRNFRPLAKRDCWAQWLVHFGQILWNMRPLGKYETNFQKGREKNSSRQNALGSKTAAPFFPFSASSGGTSLPPYHNIIYANNHVII